MSSIRPGRDGEPLPPRTLVFRIGKNAQLSPEAQRRRRALPIMFEPSSDDKASASKCISIWVEELTVADQGWAMMGANPKNTVVACLEADAIWAVPAPSGFEPMRTQWEVARLPGGELNTAPGAEGHAGIWGLIQGGDGKQDKAKKSALRSVLADLAAISPVPVPHDLAQAYIETAAYYISEKHGGCCCTNEAHWILALRQLRRERVRAARETSEEDASDE